MEKIIPELSRNIFLIQYFEHGSNIEHSLIIPTRQKSQTKQKDVLEHICNVMILTILCIQSYQCHKMNGHTIKVDNSCEIIFLPPENEFTLKGKNLLPLGANSFLLEVTPLGVNSFLLQLITLEANSFLLE